MSSLSVEFLSGGAGVVLSLIFEYVPGVHERFNKLDDGKKRGIMGLIVVLVSAVIFGLSCVNSPWNLVECNDGGMWELIQVVGFALISNQTAHRIGKRTAA